MRARTPLVVVLGIVVLVATGCSSTQNKLSSNSWKFWKKDKASSAIASTAPPYKPTLPSATVQPGSSTVAGTTGYPYNAVNAGSGTTNPFPAPGGYQAPAAAPSYSAPSYATQTPAAYNSSTYNPGGNGSSYGYQPATASQGSASTAMAPQSGYYDAGSKWGTPTTTAPAAPATTPPPATSYGASAYTATAPAGYTQENPSGYGGSGYGATSSASPSGGYASPTSATVNPYVAPSGSASPAAAAYPAAAYPAAVTPLATMPQVITPATSAMPPAATMPATSTMPQAAAPATATLPPQGSATRSSNAYVPGQSGYKPGSGYTPAGVQPYTSPAPAYQSPQSPRADTNYYPGASGAYRPGGTGSYPMLPSTSSTSPASNTTEGSGSTVLPASYEQAAGAAP